MMTAIYPMLPSQTRPSTISPLVAIVIRIGLNGTCFVQTLSGESDEQETLPERFIAAHPALEMMHTALDLRIIRCLNGAGR